MYYLFYFIYFLPTICLFLSRFLFSFFAHRAPSFRDFLFLNSLILDYFLGELRSLELSYGLDDRGFYCRRGAGSFSPHPCVHTGSGAHPASYSMLASGSFPGDKSVGA
jgi:hypothetical protein